MGEQTFEQAKAAVAEKVRKLLAKAEDPAATPEEAESFTAKAQQLMTRYSISLAMISDGAKAEQFTVGSWVINGPYAAHKVTLVNAVARNNDCRAIYTDLRGGRKRIDVVGYPTDVEWVETLSRSLEVQLAAALSFAMRKYKDPSVHGRTFSVAFVQGFTTEVAARLQKARKDAVAEADAAQEQEQPGRSSTALVLVAKSERVEQEFSVRYPRARTVRRTVRLQSWSGYDPGRAAGRNATLARGSVGGSRKALQ